MGRRHRRIGPRGFTLGQTQERVGPGRIAVVEPPVCPYCKRDAKVVFGSELYPTLDRVSEKLFWRCVPCDAHVGCHGGTMVPLGTIADRSLRRARGDAHAAFDPLWKGGGMSRTGAYAWLAKAMGMRETDCHIAMFDEVQCMRVVRYCHDRRAPSRWSGAFDTVS